MSFKASLTVIVESAELPGLLDIIRAVNSVHAVDGLHVWQEGAGSPSAPIVLPEPAAEKPAAVSAKKVKAATSATAGSVASVAAPAAEPAPAPAPATKTASADELRAAVRAVLVPYNEKGAEQKKAVAAFVTTFGSADGKPVPGQTLLSLSAEQLAAMLPVAQEKFAC